MENKPFKANNSTIHETANIFPGVRLVDSMIYENCCIGEESDIVGACLYEHSELGRRNIVRYSTLGKGSYTGTNTVINKADIGKYSSISWNVSIGGGTHQYNKVSMYTGYWFNRTFGIENTENFPYYRTQIGNDVWIASGANIIGGINIGDGCVVGAGAVVTKDIPPYSIVVGVPARVVKKRFDDETIDLLEKIQWWDWPDELIKERYAFLSNVPSKDALREMVGI